LPSTHWASVGDWSSRETTQFAIVKRLHYTRHLSKLVQLEQSNEPQRRTQAKLSVVDCCRGPLHKRANSKSYTHCNTQCERHTHCNTQCERRCAADASL